MGLKESGLVIQKSDEEGFAFTQGMSAGMATTPPVWELGPGTTYDSLSVQFKHVPPPPGMCGDGGDNYFIVKAKPGTEATEGLLVFQIQDCIDIYEQLPEGEEPTYTIIEIPVRLE